MSSTDGKKKSDDRAQWTLGVDFNIIETDGTLREVSNRNIFANNCQLGKIPAGANKTIVVLTGGKKGCINDESNTSTTAVEDVTTTAVVTTTTTTTATAVPASSQSSQTDDNEQKKKRKKKKGSSDGAAADSTLVRTASPRDKKRSKKKNSSKDVTINLTETPMHITTNNMKSHRVVAIANGRKWVEGNKDNIIGDAAKGVDTSSRWYQKKCTGEKIYPGNAAFKGMTLLEAFQHMMPPKQINLILELTNNNIKEKDKKEITRGKLFCYIGICMLMAISHYRGERRLLWGEGDECGRAISKYIPAIDLRKTQMTRRGKEPTNMSREDANARVAKEKRRAVTV